MCLVIHQVNISLYSKTTEAFDEFDTKGVQWKKAKEKHVPYPYCPTMETHYAQNKIIAKLYFVFVKRIALIYRTVSSDVLLFLKRVIWKLELV